MAHGSRDMPHVEGVRHEFVDLGHIRLHVAVAGAEDAEPVVLLHGWPQNWFEWRDVIGPLAEDHRVICPDLRGLGWSDAPPEDYRKETIAADVVALMDHMGIERAGVAGHDWGGFVAFILALNEPQRVNSLLALNIFPPFLPLSVRGALSQWRWWYQWVLASPLGPRVMRALASRTGDAVFEWLGSDGISPEEREVFRAQFREPERARASQLYYRDFQLREVPQILRGRYRGVRLEVPTLILFGTGDKVMPYRLLEGVDERFEKLSVELVHGVGHMIVDERPELVVQRARSFLGSKH